jgi:hypothetical protein
MLRFMGTGRVSHYPMTGAHVTSVWGTPSFWTRQTRVPCVAMPSLRLAALGSYWCAVPCRVSGRAPYHRLLDLSHADLTSDVLGNTSGSTGLFLHLLSDRLSITDTRFVARLPQRMAALIPWSLPQGL